MGAPVKVVCYRSIIIECCSRSHYEGGETNPKFRQDNDSKKRQHAHSNHTIVDTYTVCMSASAGVKEKGIMYHEDIKKINK